ncbi:hypothetical protein ON010_g7749 [Phytophthora cinnamomi]|nr:hypothetical protein ON010_g7749 [Phytophthora cinnamomi]
MGQSHRRVHVRTADTFGAVDAHEHGDTPGHVDAEPGSLLVFRKHDLVVDAHAEGDHDEGAEELRETFAEVRVSGNKPLLVVVLFAGVLAAVGVVKRALATIDLAR